MTDKHSLTERQQAIDLCLKACVNLYGYVTPRQFLKVFNRYNTPKLLKKELLDNAEILENCSSEYYAIYENAIINTRVSKSVIDSTIQHQDGKAYYMPTEAEVKLYARANGYTRTEYTEKLMTLLTKKLKMNIFAATAFMDKLVWFTAIDEPLQKRINLMYEFRVPLTNRAAVNDVLATLPHLNNTTRKWSNCGYTPAETEESSDK